MGTIKDPQYISPGVYGYPQNIIIDEKSFAKYKLQVMLNPSDYKWRLVGIDDNWRENFSSTKLSQAIYFIEYSNTSSPSGTIAYYLDQDTIINARCEES